MILTFYQTPLVSDALQSFFHKDIAPHTDKNNKCAES